MFEHLWTDKEVEILKAGVEQGKTARRIAEALPRFTRNAVLGKIMRLGIKRVSTNKHLKAPISAVAKQRNTPKVNKNIPKEPTPLQPPLMMHLWELGPRNCKWPIGDPKQPGFGFCGNEKEPERNYCDHHTRLGIQVR